MIDDDELALRRAQDRAIARANKRPQPTAYPGGLLARALAERSLAETLRRRHDAHTDELISNKIVGHEMCAQALEAAALA